MLTKKIGDTTQLLSGWRDRNVYIDMLQGDATAKAFIPSGWVTPANAGFPTNYESSVRAPL